MAVALSAIWRMLHPGVADAHATVVEAQLQAVYAMARNAWPAIDLAPDVYLRHVAERSDDVPDGAAAADLYLACACARGDAVALEAFSSRYLGSLAPTRNPCEPAEWRFGKRDRHCAARRGHLRNAGPRGGEIGRAHV